MLPPQAIFDDLVFDVPSWGEARIENEEVGMFGAASFPFRGAPDSGTQVPLRRRPGHLLRRRAEPLRAEDRDTPALAARDARQACTYGELGRLPGEGARGARRRGGRAQCGNTAAAFAAASATTRSAFSAALAVAAAQAASISLSVIHGWWAELLTYESRQ